MSNQDVIAYYDARTDHILRKYGPGPLVHFHTGIVDSLDLSGNADELHARIVEAQRELMVDAACAWDAPANLCARVLDVGAGLGGGALFWAREFGARVTAVTDVPRHAQLIGEFARAVALEDLVETWVGDAVAVPGAARFDAAVAIESSCYLPRRAWFECLRRVLVPGGRLQVIDCFAHDPRVAQSFDAYWRTRIGSFEEYVDAATCSGFRLGKAEHLNGRVVDFWSLSIQRTTIELASAPCHEVARLEASLRAHERLREAIGDGSIGYLRLTFERS